MQIDTSPTVSLEAIAAGLKSNVAAVRDHSMMLAKRHGLDPAQMAIAFDMSRGFVTSAIIGATTLSQLKTDIDAADLVLPDNVLSDIDQIHLDYPNPCP